VGSIRSSRVDSVFAGRPLEAIGSRLE